MQINSKSKLYAECAGILRRIRKNKTSLKSEIYKTDKPQKYMAILSQIVKNIDTYTSIISEMNMTGNNQELNLVHVHEILNNNIRVKREIKEKFEHLKNKYSCNENKEKITYFRTFDENALKEFEHEKTVLPDVYKTNISLAKNQMFIDGKIIIQNFSSCLPALVLNPDLNSKVIDCCAAPGNKSIHLSNLMKNTGKIYAYEKNTERYETLREMLRRYKCKNVKPYNKDFLDTKSVKNIDYILVDPSCSGSGIHDLYTKCNIRISKLATFQKKILLHALSFENVKKVVYSTCSVHVEENEEVVKYVLENNKNFDLEKINIPGIDTNINSQFEFADRVIRIERDVDKNIHGFFVASFVRKNTNKKN